ncbi:hypothetical protein J3R83DRAFT_6529 [Lanmaoa asiatica]|nr:hypothetical protein J3R83DRAFT_6529 [Lanmaoa asiatica]
MFCGQTLTCNLMAFHIQKLSRALHHHDERTEYAIPQIVLYQTGIGSSQNLYSEYIQGATGASLGRQHPLRQRLKTHTPLGLGSGEGARGICFHRTGFDFNVDRNFRSGDEIFLFGFSRGAYTGAIGVLDKTDMDHFADVFVAYQKLGKSNDPAEIGKLQAELAPWTSPTSRGKLRAISDDHTFSIKCVGVFDTVGSVGLPEEITRKSPSTKSIFGFPNAELGEHIERAYQTLAINETRLDFVRICTISEDLPDLIQSTSLLPQNCNKFEQTQGGRRKGQVLKQVSVGGGWHDHDLSDLTLTWMVANIGDILSVDLKYIRSLPDPVAPWGKQSPHNSRTGIFALALENTRQLPIKTDDVTHETIHPSVLEQDNIAPQLRASIQKDPLLVCSLLPLEEEMKKSWPYVPGKNVPTDSKGSAQMESATAVEATTLWSTTREVLSVSTQLGTEIIKQVQTQAAASKNTNGAAGTQLSATSWLMSLAHESHAGAVLKELAQNYM